MGHQSITGPDLHRLPGARLLREPDRAQSPDHFTPFGARVAHPPVIVLPRRPRAIYRLVAIASPLLWAAALILIGHIAFAAGHAMVALDRQIAISERV